MTASVAQKTVVSVGRLYCDLIFTGAPRLPSMGSEVFAESVGFHAGGGAYITAAYLGSLGHNSALASYLPNDALKDVVLGELELAGLDLRLCRKREKGLPPQLTVAITGTNDRAFLTNRSGAAVPPLSADDLKSLGVTHVHIAELATLVESPTLVAMARAAGASISLDCGWDEGLTAQGLAELISSVDVFLPNEAEVNHLKALGLDTPFASLTVIKQGAAGATAVRGEQSISAPARAAKVVDTTGAGDAFNAGFLSAWLASESLESCLEAGNTLGARAIGRPGGFCAPRQTPTTSGIALAR